MHKSVVIGRISSCRYHLKYKLRPLSTNIFSNCLLLCQAYHSWCNERRVTSNHFVRIETYPIAPLFMASVSQWCHAGCVVGWYDDGYIRPLEKYLLTNEVMVYHSLRYIYICTSDVFIDSAGTLCVKVGVVCV
jgi:hypothetical protein